MPVSKKPRRNNLERVSRINFYTQAGQLLYGRLIAAVTGVRHDITMQIVLERDTRNAARSRRLRSNGSWKPASNGSRECARRLRQKLVQHPSVVTRFANHPSRTEIEAVAGPLEKVKRAARRMVGAAA